MRADQRAETALDAGVGVPLRHHDGDVAFFILGGTGRIDAAFGHGRGRQLVAASGNHFAQHVFYKRGSVGRHRQFGVQRRGHLSGIFHFVQTGQGRVYGFVVLLHDFFAFLRIGFLDGFFDIGDGFFGGDDTRNTEEGRLHDGVGAAAHTGGQSNVGSVNGVNLELFVNDLLLHFGG